MKPQPSIVTASQVNTYVHYLVEIDSVQHREFSYHHGYAIGKEIRSQSGKPAQTAVFLWLEAHGFIEVIRGRENLYSLCRPLSTIKLVDIVHRMAMPVTSPLFLLLTHRPTLSLIDVVNMRYPESRFPYPGALYSFDFILRLLRSLDAMPRLTYTDICAGLSGHSRSYTYTVGALGVLSRSGLVYSNKVGGYRLCYPFETLTLDRVIPVVSHRDTLFNKMLYASRSSPLSLFV